MKTFREHLSEHSGHFSRQWLDQDTMPSAPHALEALNSLIGQMAEQEYLNPQVGIEKLQSGLGKLGYHFEAPTLSGLTTDTLRTGQVVTVEPGVYLPDVGGVRWEDTVIVTEQGSEFLTHSPKIM